MIKIDQPIRFGLFLLFVILLLAGGSWLAWRYISRASLILRDGDLAVTEGQGASQVWQQATEQGYTATSLPWRYHAWRTKSANQVKAGTYHLSAGESIASVWQRLIDGESVSNDLKVTFPEGFTLDQMASRLAAQDISDAEEFIQNAQPAAFAGDFPFLADLPAGRDLEGYLFPDTYRFTSGTSAEDIVYRLLANFNRRLTPDLLQSAKASGRTLDQIMIMASIIEREVQSDDDMAMVSGILWKRHDEEIGLWADATIRYALKNWDEPLSAADLDYDSPYNTRKYRGLPPSPICNPGLRAIIAAINPEASDFYYYLSTPDGKTVFARTNDEHNANKARYLR